MDQNSIVTISEIQKAENKITSIAFNDPILGKYFCYVLDSHNKLSSSNKVDTIVAFKDEYDLHAKQLYLSLN